MILHPKLITCRALLFLYKPDFNFAEEANNP